MGTEPVIATVGNGRVSVFASADGRRLWTAQTPVCLEQAFTASGALIAPDTCVGPHALMRFDLSTGARTEHPFRGFNDRLTVTPLGCKVGRSECGGVRMLQVPNRTAAWLITPDGFVDAPALASVTATLAGQTAIDSPLGETNEVRAIVGRDPRTGTSLWTFGQGAPVRVIAANSDRVLLLGRDLRLTALDPATGRILSSDSIALKQDRDAYAIGSVYAVGPYVAIERLKPKADPTGTDDEYYYNARPVLLAMS
jgi:hypothetical protein